MKILKKVLLVLAIAFIVIQFVRPEKNLSNFQAPEQALAPPEVQRIIKSSCYDCHSNNTRYPWYSEVQPVAWWLGSHISDGKKELNFDEFADYRLRRQYRKLGEIEEQIKKDEMPLPSYLWIHKDAILSADDKSVLINWSVAMRDSMKARYPIDSLERRPAKQ
jgi:hypothetical protein